MRAEEISCFSRHGPTLLLLRIFLFIFFFALFLVFLVFGEKVVRKWRGAQSMADARRVRGRERVVMVAGFSLYRGSGNGAGSR